MERPRDWEQAVSVAYLRITDSTQEQAALVAGVSERTVQAWEASDWWPDAKRTAEERWARGLRDKIRRSFWRALDDPEEYAAMARYLGDRMLEEMLPPKIRSEISGPNGGPIEVRAEDMSDDELAGIAAGK